MQTTRNRHVLIATSVLAFASAVVAVTMVTAGGMSYAAPGTPIGMAVSTPSPTSSGHLPGMDHGSGDMAGMDMPATEMPTSGHGHGDMPGMDMPATDMPTSGHGSGGHESAPTPTMPGDMPGMDHGSGGHESAPTPTMPGDMPGMDHGSGDSPGKTDEHGAADEKAVSRPLAPVLGTFGAGTSAVMLTAGLLRRKDRARAQAKEAARAARRSQS